MKKWFLAIVPCIALAQSIPPDHGASLILKKAESTTPIEHFISAAEMAVMMCGMVLSKHNADAKNPRYDLPDDVVGTDFRGCIKNYQSALSQLHDSTSKQLKSKPQKAALKEYFVLAMHATEGVSPLPGERVIQYEKRTQGELADLRKQAIRLKSEK